MRHRKAGRKLGRDAAHRKAMLSNMATSLMLHERIKTTLPRAKELRSFAEPLITAAKKDSLHARRTVARRIHDKNALRKLFSQLGPRFAERPGGYTRIYKLGHRRGDAAEMAVIELVDRSDAATPQGADEAAAPKRRLIERDDADTGAEKAGGEQGADDDERA